MKEQIRIAPQEGPQTEFLSTIADICIFGGAAGSGKSFGLLLEPLRHYDNPKFGGVIFRRQATQVRNEGGLWQESQYLYPLLGAKPREMNLEWTFPSKMRLKFAHLEHEKTVLEWQGSQIPFLGFDELTHFSENQFFYMLSRNRSTSGVRAYVRATCNADADSWVRRFIDWWIDPASGFPIKARSGVIRWFIRQGNELRWADSPKELIKQYGKEYQPKSVTFISAVLQDNKILMEKDPGYLSNLLALDRVERERLLLGNWNSRPSSGMYFRKEYFKIVDNIPGKIIQQIRYWDRASTMPNETNKDPDWTRGCKLAKLDTGQWIVIHMAGLRGSPLEVEAKLKQIAQLDGYEVPIGLEQDPGSAGVSDISNMVRLLAGYSIRINKPSKDKVTRASPVSAQCEQGHILVLKSYWNDEFFRELENFPSEGSSSHDDQVDALSGAFNELSQGNSILDVL